MGRPSRPKFGRRGHVNTGRSGGAGVVVVTTPKGPAVTLEPATAVVGVDPGVGAVLRICKVYFWSNILITSTSLLIY